MEKLSKTLKFACIQLKVGLNKADNVARAVNQIRNAKLQGAELIALPGLIMLKHISFGSHCNCSTYLLRMFQFTIRS